MAININEASYNDKGFILVSWDRYRFTNVSSFIAQVSSIIPNYSLTNINIYDPNSISCQFPYFILPEDKCTITLFAYDSKNNFITTSTSQTISINR